MNLLLIATIPLLSLLSMNSKLASHVTRFAPAIFFALICGIFFKAHREHYLEIVNFNKDITFGFVINKNNIQTLLLLGFIWLIFGFYIERFLIITNNKNASLIRSFFGLAIAFINLIILAKNLVTVLFFYNLLALSFYFFLTKIFIKNEDKYSKIFTYLVLFEPILLFAAIIFTVFFGGHLNFAKNGTLENLTFVKTLFLFFLYSAAILPTILLPLFLLYHKNYNFDVLTNYLALPLFYALPKIYIFCKIIAEIFGFGIISHLLSKIGLWPFSLIFAINLAILAYFLLFSRDFKVIFFYLFLGQFVFSFFTIFVFANFDDERIRNILPNFILSITLIFLTFSNLVLYLRRAENKDTTGLFYEMKITIFLMMMGFLNLIGFMPTAMMSEKFALARIVFHEESPLLTLIFIMNICSLALFSCKLFFPMLTKVEIARSENDKKLAAKIDSSASLMLTSVVVAATMLLLPIIKFLI